MKTLIVRPAAEQELRSATRWYEEKCVGLGLEFVALVDRAFTKIQRNPLSYPVWDPERDYRRSNLARFPYSVFYRVENEHVVVIAVAHQRQRAGYWIDKK